MYWVLIADDEPQDRSIIKILLNRKYADQFKILEAENGIEALKMLRQHPIQLLLLDINMPGLNGLEVLHQLPYMPYIIILTAHNCFEYTREALRSGVRDYLLKPPLREEFYRSIDQFAADSAQRQELVSLETQSREVFTRDLAQQMMFYGNYKKIKGLLDVLDVSADCAMCSILRCPQEMEQDTDYLLDEVEEMLDASGMAYAADTCDGGVVVFLLYRKRRVPTEKLLQTFAQLTNHLESNLCVAIQSQIGTELPIKEYPRGFLNLVGANQKTEGPLLSPERIAQFEKAIRHREFDMAMEQLRPILEVPAPSDLIKFELISVLVQCAGQALLQEDRKHAYARVSGLISADSCDQIRRIVADYIHWMMERQPSRQQNNVIQTIVDQVSQDCSRPWTIECLADTLHMNSYYLSHLFKEYTGRCFTDFLAEQRIGRAVELMKTTRLNFTEIGERVGYSDPNYFSRVFKKRKGIGLREFYKTL